MNDFSNQNDQAERIRALQARRAASAQSRRAPSTASRSAKEPASTRQRRRHAAAGTRIFLAGLSVSSFFAVAGAIGLAHRSTSTAQAATTASQVGTAASGGTAATPGAASAAVVHTVTKGS